MTLLASPLAFRFAFNFMTDIPYMTWSVVAIFAYTRGWRTASLSWAVLGSLAAAAAILPRQFGVPLVLVLAAARVFVERFPGCEESEALLMEIPTLKANAEIDARQFLEAKIMDCARHGRYIEAVDLAKKVIAQFPESPQAEALRKQLDRLQ